MTDAEQVAHDMQNLHDRMTRLIAECRALREGLPWTFDEPKPKQLSLFEG